MFSRNVPTVKMVDSIGLKYVLSYLPHFGFKRPFPRNLSIALGTAEVTLEEMIEAYAVFPNLGVRVEPRYFTHMIDDQGTRIDVPIESVRAIPADTAYIMVDMMRDVIERGTGKDARIDRPAAGKTGTTNDRRDVWFIGYVPQLVTGVWVGYDQDRTLRHGEAGGKTAAPLWREFMEKTLENTEPTEFEVPNDVVLVDVGGVMQVREGRHKTLLTARKPLTPTAKKDGEETVADADQAKAEKAKRIARARRRAQAQARATAAAAAAATANNVPAGTRPGQPVTAVAAPPAVRRVASEAAPGATTRVRAPAPSQAQGTARSTTPKQAPSVPARSVPPGAPSRSGAAAGGSARASGAL